MNPHEHGSPDEPAASRPGRALLLLDFQHDFLDERGRMPVALHHVRPVLAAAGAALDQAQHDGQLIIKVGNEFRRGDRLRNILRRSAAIAGTAGAAWDTRIDAPGAIYLPKWKSDAFSNPALDELLAEHHIDRIAVAGLYARACVTATTKSALRRGLRVQLLCEAIACRTDRSRHAALKRLAKHGAEVVTCAADRTNAMRP